jgi:predicted dehydrogenase
LFSYLFQASHLAVAEVKSNGGAFADLCIYLMDVLRFVLGDISLEKSDKQSFITTR